jgi:hypothetical protein
MPKKRLFSMFITIILTAAAISGLSGCSTSTSPTTTSPTTTIPTTASPVPGGPGGAVINSDSIVTAKIQAIRPQTSGYPWDLDILVQTSTDVGSLPNPTKDSVGKVITVKTDQDMTSFKVNDNISARVKYVGDVPKPGITLYIYNIVKS